MLRLFGLHGGCSVGLDEGGGRRGEVAAEVFFLQEEIPLVWARLDLDGAGVVLEAFLEPEEVV